jgi:predicted transcriptional regulator
MISIRLDEELAEALNKAARLSGRSRSEVAREALRRHLSITTYEQLRRRIAPFAESRGWLTDEDVFRNIS